MVSEAPSEPEEDMGYVQDGLVFHLDGINKGSNPTRWESLVGDYYFTFNEHATLESNAVLMDGNGYLSGAANGDPNGYLNVSASDGTIEACVQYLGGSNSGFIFANKFPQTLWLIVSPGGITYRGVGTGTDGSQNIIKFPNLTDLIPNPFTVSLEKGAALLNGLLAIGTASDGWNNQRFSISNDYYNKSFRLFSLRVYNRQLTYAEMLANQAVDNERFNLGLGEIREVQYVDGNGTYLDTGLKLNNHTIIAEMQLSQGYQNSAALFGIWNDLQTHLCYVTLYNNKYYFGTFAASEKNVAPAQPFDTDWHTYKLTTTGLFQVDDDVLYNTANDPYQYDRGFFLFARRYYRGTDSSTYFSICPAGVRCRSLKVIDRTTGQLVLDCVPVKVGNVGYMMDRLTGGLLSSATSTPLLPGPIKPGTDGWCWCYYDIPEANVSYQLMYRTDNTLDGIIEIDGVTLTGYTRNALYYTFSTPGRHLVKYKEGPGTSFARFEGASTLVEAYMTGNMPENTSRYFDGCSGLTKLVLPETYNTLNLTMFGNCTSLKELNSRNATTVNGRLLGNNGVELLEMPNVVHITDQILRPQADNNVIKTVDVGPYCEDIMGVWLYGSSTETIIMRATTPPTCGSPFYGLNTDYKLYVPYSADHSVLAAYQAANGWSAAAARTYELDPDGSVPII